MNSYVCNVVGVPWFEVKDDRIEGCCKKRVTRLDTGYAKRAANREHSAYDEYARFHVYYNIG